MKPWSEKPSFVQKGGKGPRANNSQKMMENHALETSHWSRKKDRNQKAMTVIVISFQKRKYQCKYIKYFTLILYFSRLLLNYNNI